MRFHIPILVVALFAGVATARAGDQSPSDYDKCKDDEQKPGVRIIACSHLIEDFTTPRSVQAEAFASRGEAYSNQGDYSRAIADENEALLLQPDYAEAYNLRAWVNFKSGRPEQGLEDAEKAVSLQPQSAYSLDTRGHIYEALGRKEEALADYRRAAAIDPDLRESQDGVARLSVAR
jgi:tetratricopeptide (TPR) repeat protein